MRICFPLSGSIARYRVLEWQNFITSELHKTYSPLFNPSADPAVKNYAVANLRKKYSWVNDQLRGRAYLTGDTFTIADAYLFAVTNWAGIIKFDLADYTQITAFQARVAARPAVLAAMQAEGLLDKAA